MSALLPKKIILLCLGTLLYLIIPIEAIANEKCYGYRRCSDTQIGTTDEKTVQGDQIIIIEKNNARRINSENKCLGCKWKFGPRCENEAATHNAAGSNACQDAKLNRKCAIQHKAGIIWDLYRTIPGQSFELTDSYCYDGIVRVAREDELRREIIEFVDKLSLKESRLRMQPSNGITISNFPTLFYDLNKNLIIKKFFPLGIPVTIIAKPTTWHWNIDNGLVNFSTIFPGITYKSDRQ